MCEPTTLALGQAAVGVAGAVGGQMDRNNQYAANAAQLQVQNQYAQMSAASQTAWNNARWQQGIAMKRQQWAREVQRYNFSKQTYESGRQWNALAASRANNSEARRLDGVFKEAAFQDQEGFTKLLQMQGKLSATGNASGKSMDYLQNDVLAAFGRNKAIQDEQLRDAVVQTGHNMTDTWYDQYNKDINAWSQVAIAPEYGMDEMAPMPVSAGPPRMPGPPPSSMGMWTGIANAGLGLGQSLIPKPAAKA